MLCNKWCKKMNWPTTRDVYYLTQFLYGIWQRLSKVALAESLSWGYIKVLAGAAGTWGLNWVGFPKWLTHIANGWRPKFLAMWASAWMSLWHGSWLPLEWVIPEKDRRRSCNTSYDLVSGVILCPFCRSLFVRSESLVWPVYTGIGLNRSVSGGGIWGLHFRSCLPYTPTPNPSSNLLLPT